MKIRYKIWLESDGLVIFGQGREELLRTIEECRSINLAAKKLGMSYRAAWGRLKASEARLGVKLVARSGQEGTHLTQEAKNLLEKYDNLEKEISFLTEKISDEFSRRHFRATRIPLPGHEPSPTGHSKD